MMNLTANPVFQHTLRMMTNPDFQFPSSLGEVIVAQVLEQKGYAVWIANPVDHGYQFRVSREGKPQLRLAVRTAQMTQATPPRVRKAKHVNAWKFRIRRTSDEKLFFDLAILLCLLDPGKVIAFVVPRAEVQSIGTVVIYTDPWTYKGRFAKYRQSLYQIDLDRAGS